MAHLFRQVYSDDIVSLKCLTQAEQIAAITTEVIKRKIDELHARKEDRMPIEEAMVQEFCRWWTFLDQAKELIDREKTWRVILEAFKILKYEAPSANCQRSFHQLFRLSCLGLYTVYSDINRTISFENLMDYLTCICKLKYKYSV